VKYTPNPPWVAQDMLNSMGLNSLDDLFDDIKDDLKLKSPASHSRVVRPPEWFLELDTGAGLPNRGSWPPIHLSWDCIS
jgi:glycine cleavage system pyridoxal-binding protein P